MIATAPREGAKKKKIKSFCRKCTSCIIEVTDKFVSEIKDRIAQQASGKAVPVVTNCAAMGDLKKTDFRIPILRGRTDDREITFMWDIGCEGVVVCKGLVVVSQLTVESCLLIWIDKTALLAEKAMVNLRTPYLCGQLKALCISGAICRVMVGSVKGREALRILTCL
ncbi:hypothetical protein PoB_000563000 [Plakobranchus ocellatus]|uniref:Uncharacterized protein n=1 Tax=Plakobranchus ocellatus TaxID=259542 RepID=A0AAV3Y8K0_9GAST|nr:hypothetical protein PoB_000563000 [Plakobranchus ocellatus]